MQKLDLISVKADFPDYVEALQKDLEQRSTWTDTYDGGTGETLIEHNSAIGTYSQWSIEQAFKEGFLETAGRDSSIYAMTRMLGVRLIRRIPGIQIATLSRASQLAQPITGSVSIPEYSQFSIAGIDYFNRSVVNFGMDINGSPVSTVEKVLLQQGTIKYRSYLSDGTDFQQFAIPSSEPMSISDLDIKVVIEGETWVRVVDGLWKYGSTDLVFSEDTSGTGDVVLLFGNGINGKKPGYGATIDITYAETLGAKSPIVSAATVVKLSNALNSSPPQLVSGFVTRDNILQSTEGSSLASVNLYLNSATAALPIITVPLGSTWSKSFVGLQIEETSGSGLGIITFVSGRNATVSVISPFSDILIPSGSWILTTSSTGQDEKPASYYKVTASMLFKANGRAVTTDDHIAYCLTYPGVGDVSIRFERDLLLRLIVPLWAKDATPPTNPIENQDYILTTTDAHPKLMNIIWVSILPDSGVAWTNSQWSAFLAWFDTYKYKGSILKPQNPIKDPKKLRVKLMCSLNSDLNEIAISAREIILEIFNTNQRILNKRIAITDISNKLKLAIPAIDYMDFFDPDAPLENNSANDFIPTPVTIHPVTGIPLPPSYVSLASNDLVLEMGFTSRNTVNYIDPDESAGNFTKVTRADGSIQLIPS